MEIQMLNLETLKENINLIKSLRESFDVDGDDQSKDYRIQKLSAEDAFDHFLVANGIIGYGHRLSKVIASLRTSLDGEKINHNKLAEVDVNEIIDSLRQGADFPEVNSQAFDEGKFKKYINSLSFEKAVSAYLSWNGIIGYENKIILAWNTLQKST